MRISNRAFAVLAALCLGLLGTTSLAKSQIESAQARERQIRTIPYTPSPIAERLRPEDDIVVVEWNLGVPVESGLSPAERLQAAVSDPSVTVAVVTVDGVSGVLALENSWIHTKFVATVDQVLKTGSSVKKEDRVSRGRAVEFFVHGGEAAVNGVVVRARDVVRYPISRKYLVFLRQKMHENGWTLSSSVPLLIDGEGLSAIAPAKSDISGLTLADVNKAVRGSR